LLGSQAVSREKFIVEFSPFFCISAFVELALRDRLLIHNLALPGEVAYSLPNSVPVTSVSDPDPHGSALDLSPGSIQQLIKLAPKAKKIHII
jgi:hypothetical protein